MLKKRNWLGLVVAGCFLFVSLSVMAGEQALIEKAARNAISQALDSLAKSEKVSNIKTIAVYPLRKSKEAGAFNEDITDLVTIELSRTKYQVILRQQLLKIMDEQGFIMGKVDLFNPDTVKKLGGFLGVDAIVWGEVKEASSDVRGATVRLNLKMANVETGEMVWGEAVTGKTLLSPQDAIKTALAGIDKQIMGGIAIAAIVLILIIVLAARRKQTTSEQINYKQKENRLKTDRAVRTKITGELSKSINRLREARDIAHKNGQNDTVNKLKGVSNEIDSLRMEVDNAEYGNSSFFTKEGVSADAIGRMVDFDRAFDSMVKDAIASANELHESVSSSETGEISGKVEELEKKVSQLKAKFNDRRDYLRGLA